MIASEANRVQAALMIMNECMESRMVYMYRAEKAFASMTTIHHTNNIPNAASSCGLAYLQICTELITINPPSPFSLRFRIGLAGCILMTHKDHPLSVTSGSTTILLLLVGTDLSHESPYTASERLQPDESPQSALHSDYEASQAENS